MDTFVYTTLPWHTVHGVHFERYRMTGQERNYKFSDPDILFGGLMWARRPGATCCGGHVESGFLNSCCSWDLVFG